MIDLTNVSKDCGLVKALGGITFHVSAGEIVGLLGPNGAGKTTLMKILTGYLLPDEGRATVNDLDVLTDPLKIQKRIGYLPENAPLYPELSVQAHLRMAGAFSQSVGRSLSEQPAIRAECRGLVGRGRRPVDHPLAGGLRPAAQTPG